MMRFFNQKYSVYKDKNHINQHAALIQKYNRELEANKSNGIEQNAFSIHQLGLYIVISGGLINLLTHINDKKEIDSHCIDFSMLLICLGFLLSQCTNLTYAITSSKVESDVTWCFKDFCPMTFNQLRKDVSLGFSAGVVCILLQCLIGLNRTAIETMKNFSFPRRQLWKPRQPDHPLEQILLPLFEEAMCRGSILPLYKKGFEKCGVNKINAQTWAIIFDSLTFMALHRPFFINHFFMGLFFGELMDLTDSRLLAPYIAHAINNAIVNLIYSVDDECDSMILIGVLWLSFMALYEDFYKTFIKSFYQRYLPVNRQIIIQDLSQIAFSFKHFIYSYTQETSVASMNIIDDINELSPIRFAKI